MLLSALFPLSALAGGNDQIFKCKVDGLHPTQLAVGMEEVKEKEHKFKKMDGNELEKYEQDNPEPVVAGPGGALYIIDHHHLARALMDIGVNKTYCTQMADYSRLMAPAFWKKMEEKKWVYTYDEYGNGPRPYSEIPDTVGGLKDDPYRSLAGAVRSAGGYEKTDAPFAEFKWADFFRDKFSRKDLINDFDHSVNKAVKIAHSPAASALPGYLK
jgi:hypothetical protein